METETKVQIEAYQMCHKNTRKKRENGPEVTLEKVIAEHL